MESMERTALTSQDYPTEQCQYGRVCTTGRGWVGLVRMSVVGLMLFTASCGKTSVADEAVNINLDAGSINLFGFYNGMPKADAEALAAHYGLEADAYTFEEISATHEVYGMYFSLDDIRRISNAPDAVDTFEDFVRFLLRSPMFKISKPTRFVNLTSHSYSCTTSDGVEFKLSLGGDKCELHDPERFIEAQEATIEEETLDEIKERFHPAILREIEEVDYE